MSFSNVSQLREELNKTSGVEILSKFFDDGSFCETDALLSSEGGFAEAVTGYGTVMGMPVYAFAQNSDVCSGAMSVAQAKKIAKIYDLATKTGAPVVGFYDSCGGRLEQKSDLLAAYGEILGRASKISGVVPQISVVLGTCLGTSALIAASADFVVKSKDAQISVDVAADKDDSCCVADIECDDKDAAIDKARDLVTYFPSNNLESAPLDDSMEPDYDEECVVCSIADADSFVDISEGVGEGACVAFGRVKGEVTGFVETYDKIDCKAANKVAKFVRFCDAYSIPVVTVVDTKGFTCLKGAVKVTAAYAEATTAKISVITGEAVGATYVALAGESSGADIRFAVDGAVISPVNTKALAFIMDEESMNVPVDEQDKVAKEFAQREFSALNAAQCGYVDDVIDKSQLRAKVVSALEMLSSKRVETLPKKHSTI